MCDPGFPAADVDVRAFLTVDETQSDKILCRYHAFLTALFTTARHYLQNINKEITPPQTIAQKFRLLMTAGQTFKYQGAKRCDFYSAVVKCANEVISMSCKAHLLLTCCLLPASAITHSFSATGIPHPTGYPSSRHHFTASWSRLSIKENDVYAKWWLPSLFAVT